MSDAKAIVIDLPPAFDEIRKCLAELANKDDVESLRTCVAGLQSWVGNLAANLSRHEYDSYRDECAKAAMQGAVAAKLVFDSDAILARMAFDLADAMVAEKERRVAK
jgi:hypothetical protein